jgi:NAD(P)-dependent dehydrogenase (short-subunit alcohol dehydrogenase family)
MVQKLGQVRSAKGDRKGGVVEFLASEGASYVTGAIVPINGGMRMD